MSILNSLLQITIFSGVIFLATLLLKKAFKNKMSPFMHFAVWAVFLLRLIVPVTLDAPIRLFTYQPASVVMPIQTSQSIDKSASVSLEPISVPLAEESITTAIPDVSPVSVQATAPAVLPAVTAKPLTADQFVLTVWLGGTAVGLLYIALLAVLLSRKIALKSAPASAHLQALFAEVRNELHIKPRLRLLCQYECGSPALLFPRTILMPMDKLAVMDDEQIKNCLRHECMHYKRRDHLTSLFLTVLNAVYWFNPFLWLAYFEIRKDMETACDGAVVKHLDPAARRGYAELILNLSGKARQIPMVLAMSRSKKSAERRIKGIFMAQTSKRSVKFVSITLAPVLLLCCFTTACQPTPLAPPVVNKASGISAEMIADPLLQGTTKEIDAPQHWKETLTLQDGRMQINADLDVKIPDNLSNTPVYKLEQIPLTPERLQQLAQYFVGDSKFYKPLPMTQFEGLAQLKKIQNAQGMFGDFNIDDLKLMSNKLQELIDIAPDTVDKVYTDLSFSLPYHTEYRRVLDAYLSAYGISILSKKPNIQNYVDVFAETGEEYEPQISASTYDSSAAIPSRFKMTYPGSILTASTFEQMKQENEMQYTENYEIAEPLKSYIASKNQLIANMNDVMASISEAPEQALAEAQKALYDLGINDLNLDVMEKGVWLPRQPQEWDEFSTPVSKAQGGYSFVFARSAGQLAGFRSNYGSMSAGDLPQYTPPFIIETVEIFISNGKILQFDWHSMSQPTETVASNTNLLPFDQIKKRLADYLSYIRPDYLDSDGEPIDDTIHIQITDAELRSCQIPAKDDPYKAWIVPSWLFKFRITYTVNDVNYEYIQPESICEINALDGGIIIPMN